jgi:ketosteroid isomerase-like protein
VSRENVEAARRLIDAFNHRNLDVMLGEVDADIEWNEDARYPGATTFHGPAGVEQSVRQWWDAWDITIDAEEMIDLGGQVLVVGHNHARGQGSDVTVTGDYAGLIEFRDGKVVRTHMFGSREEAMALVSEG